MNPQSAPSPSVVLSRTPWGFVIFAVSVLSAPVVAPSCPSGSGLLPVVSWTCAVLSLFWCAIAQASDTKNHSVGLVGSARRSALLCGVISALVQVTLITIRAIYVATDLLNGTPWLGTRSDDFAPGGIWTPAILFGSCALALLCTGHGALYTCLLWCTTMIGVWACLSLPTFYMSSLGVYERTGSTLAVLGSLAFVVIVAAQLGIWLERRRRPRPEPACLVGAHGRERSWPGFARSCGVLSLGVLLLAVYHLVVPVGSSTGWMRWDALATAGACVLACYSTALLGHRAVSSWLAETSFGLAALALTALAVAVVPAAHKPMAEQYPSIFNAMMVGLTISAGAIAHIFGRALKPRGPALDTQSQGFNSRDSAKDGEYAGNIVQRNARGSCRANTELNGRAPNQTDSWESRSTEQSRGLEPRGSVMSEDLNIPVSYYRAAALRATFSITTLAILISAEMAVWPRLPGVAATDDTLPRVVAGLTANFILAVVALSIALRCRRSSYYFLSLAALVSGLGFLFIRIWPFVAGYG